MVKKKPTNKVLWTLEKEVETIQEEDYETNQPSETELTEDP